MKMQSPLRVPFSQVVMFHLMRGRMMEVIPCLNGSMILQHTADLKEGSRTPQGKIQTLAVLIRTQSWISKIKSLSTSLPL